MWVEFKATKPDNYKEWEKYIKTTLFNKTYKLVLSEPIELNVETEWTESAGADIAKKVNQIFNSKAIKIFAGGKGSMHAPTDSWTQKTTEIGKPLSIKLKFRIYSRIVSETNNKQQSYMDMLQFLILICAPRKVYSVANNAIDPLIAAAQRSKEFFQRLKADNAVVKNEKGETIEDPGEKASETEKQEYRTLKEIGASKERSEILKSYNTDKTDKNFFSEILGVARYNYTLQLKSKIFNFDPEKDENREMDWYIKSFNWKPSTEIRYVNDLAYPLWVDFELNLETCCSWPKSWIEKILIS
jgi:hypothetical protein